MTRFHRGFIMFGLKVPVQVNFSLKVLGADDAGEWLETRMLSTMCDQVGGLTECFSTNITLMWFFTLKVKK